VVLKPGKKLLNFSRPLDVYLRSNYNAPVHTLTGFYHPVQEQMHHWVKGLVFWLGFLLILFGFGYLEVQIGRAIMGAVRTLVLMIVMTIELGAVLVWNRII